MFCSVKYEQFVQRIVSMRQKNGYAGRKNRGGRRLASSSLDVVIFV